MDIDQIELLKADWRAALFPPTYRLVPHIHEVYELHLAYLESRLLTDEEVIQNGIWNAWAFSLPRQVPSPDDQGPHEHHGIEAVADCS